MAPVKLYGMPYSTCTRRVLAVLEEKGIDYELIPVDLMKGEHKAPAHLARQPFGIIPALEDGDITLFESRAIARYLATTYADKGTDLLGKDTKQKALTDVWYEVESQEFNGPCAAIVVQRFFNPVFFQQPTDEEVVKAKIAALNKVLDVYEARLAKQQYLAGDSFSLADLSHLPYFQYALEHCKVGPDVLDNHPNVKAWWERISSRPTWQKIVKA